MAKGQWGDNATKVALAIIAAVSLLTGQIITTITTLRAAELAATTAATAATTSATAAATHVATLKSAENIEKIEKATNSLMDIRAASEHAKGVLEGRELQRRFDEAKKQDEAKQQDQ